ncbi:hypothetical protein ACI1MP_08260 [Kitasatospora griseola]|uniref:hypothetical protein n=1 Tax=Kitasatospora griseola TaxID=2064 RepID=UPI00385592D8
MGIRNIGIASASGVVRFFQVRRLEADRRRIGLVAVARRLRAAGRDEHGCDCGDAGQQQRQQQRHRPAGGRKCGTSGRLGPLVVVCGAPKNGERE